MKHIIIWISILFTAAATSGTNKNTIMDTEAGPFHSEFTELTNTSSETADSLAAARESLRREILKKFELVQGDFAVAYINLQDESDTLFINADELFHAASTMKTPVLIEAYRQARDGGFSILDSIRVYNEFRSIADGSLYSVDVERDSDKDLHGKIGEYMPVRDILYTMTILSGNLATNLIIEELDARRVTQTMRELGAEKIEVLRGVEDMKAFEAGLSNRTTARDLAVIFKHLARGTAVSEEADADMIRILLDQRFRNVIPARLPSEVKVAHKTGSISGVVHDSGIVYLPDGRTYVMVFLSGNLAHNQEGTEAGAVVSEMIYRWFANYPDDAGASPR